MKPQIQLQIFIPEVTPADSAFPIRVALFRLIPPKQRSPLSFEIGVGLAKNDAGEVEGYSILLNGERMDPETVDTLPEAIMRAALNLNLNTIPQYLAKHIREYAMRSGVETAFMRRPAYRGVPGIEEEH